MQIDEKQIKLKQKVGLLQGFPVLRLLTKGGLNILASMQKGVIKVLGVGPQLAIAKAVAMDSGNDIAWEDSLSKSEDASLPIDEQVIDKYRNMTDTMNKLV